MLLCDIWWGGVILSMHSATSPFVIWQRRCEALHVGAYTIRIILVFSWQGHCSFHKHIHGWFQHISFAQMFDLAAMTNEWTFLHYRWKSISFWYSLTNWLTRKQLNYWFLWFLYLWTFSAFLELKPCPQRPQGIEIPSMWCASMWFLISVMLPSFPQTLQILALPWL